MTPTRTEYCLNLIGWTNETFASRLDVDVREVRRWRSGKSRMPQPIEDYVELCTAFHEANPPPPNPAGVRPKL